MQGYTVKNISCYFTEISGSKVTGNFLNFVRKITQVLSDYGKFSVFLRKYLEKCINILYFYGNSVIFNERKKYGSSGNFAAGNFRKITSDIFSTCKVISTAFNTLRKSQ